MYEDISVEEAYKLLNCKGVVFLDVRLFEDYNIDKIPGAMHIFFGDYDFDELAFELDKDMEYVIYCKVGVGSLKAINLMKDMGFKKLYNLVGGIDKWRECGYEVK